MLQTIWFFVSAWYNLPFTILLGLGLFLALLQLGGLGGGDDSDGHDLGHDVNHDLDHDLDHDFAHDVDHDLDHDVDHDLDHDLGHNGAGEHVIEPISADGSADHGDGAHGDADHFSLLAFIGIGKTPLLVVLLILFASIALLGWLFNGVLGAVFGGFPGLLIFFTGPTALISGALLTSRVTRFIGKTLPPIHTTATRALALVGMTGVVISPYIDEKYGMVHLRDQGGTLISIFAVTDETPPIPRGEKVLLVAYQSAERRYQARRKLPLNQ